MREKERENHREKELAVKGIDHPKMRILSSFTPPHVVPNQKD